MDETRRVHTCERLFVCFAKILNKARGDLLTSRMPEEAPKQDIETFNNPWHDAHVRVVECNRGSTAAGACSIFRSGLVDPKTQHPPAKTSTPPQSQTARPCLVAAARPLLDSPSLVEPLPVVSASFALLDAIDALTTSYYPYYLPPPHRASTTHAHVHSPPIYHITTRLASPLFSRASHCDILLLRGPQHTLTTSQSNHIRSTHFGTETPCRTFLTRATRQLQPHLSCRFTTTFFIRPVHSLV